MPVLAFMILCGRPITPLLLDVTRIMWSVSADQYQLINILFVALSSFVLAEQLAHQADTKSLSPCSDSISGI